MYKVFIEAQSEKTSECFFLKTLIKRLSINENSVKFYCIKGIKNLFNEVNTGEIRKAQREDDNVVIIVDADTVEKRAGFAERKKQIEDFLSENGFSVPYFIYPNNHDDGTVEDLELAAARGGKHTKFFSCFGAYENCIGREKDQYDNPLYTLPNLKGKLYAYMELQRKSDSQLSGSSPEFWQFDNPDFWNLDVKELKELKDFLKENMI